MKALIVDELELVLISPAFSSTARCRQRSASFHTTMAKKKRGKQQQVAATPEKNQEPLIEERFTWFAVAAQPPSQ
jgi:hypothetical protein